jgi:hypothetical protein
MGLCFTGCVTEGYQGDFKTRHAIMDDALKNDSLLDTLRNVGTPSGYEYFSQDKTLMLYYNCVEICVLWFWDEEYKQYQFYFKLNPDNVLASKIIHTRRIIALGKNYMAEWTAPNQMPLSQFLNKIVADKTKK